MSVDIRKHPDAPDPESLQDVVIEPIPADEIERRRDDGQVLVEDNVRERDDLNVIAYLSPNPAGRTPRTATNSPRSGCSRSTTRTSGSPSASRSGATTAATRRSPPTIGSR